MAETPGLGPTRVRAREQCLDIAGERRGVRQIESNPLQQESMQQAHHHPRAVLRLDSGGNRARRAMLESGEIDALVSVDVPRALRDGSTTIARLFPDYERVERDYYRRTGIFPPMHIVAVRRELVEHTEMLRSVYRAFVEAKELVQEAYRHDAGKQHMSLLTPWSSSHFDENEALLGHDWWPYGLRANRAALDTFLRYHYEQGLSGHLLTSEDIVVPAFLDT
ncbi:hypothetical protein [Nocardia sp. GAS34]|uniref:hypothetical protein n=1 Tax=unclassified Nocardia TaxID=2637762 RepID=UPI003D1CEB59